VTDWELEPEDQGSRSLVMVSARRPRGQFGRGSKAVTVSHDNKDTKLLSGANHDPGYNFRTRAGSIRVQGASGRLRPGGAAAPCPRRRRRRPAPGPVTRPPVTFKLNRRGLTVCPYLLESSFHTVPADSDALSDSNLKVKTSRHRSEANGWTVLLI
jgi:hypothetical protein